MNKTLLALSLTTLYWTTPASLINIVQADEGMQQETEYQQPQAQRGGEMMEHEAVTKTEEQISAAKLQPEMTAHSYMVEQSLKVALDYVQGMNRLVDSNMMLNNKVVRDQINAFNKSSLEALKSAQRSLQEVRSDMKRSPASEGSEEFSQSKQEIEKAMQWSQGFSSRSADLLTNKALFKEELSKQQSQIEKAIDKQEGLTKKLKS